MAELRERVPGCRPITPENTDERIDQLPSSGRALPLHPAIQVYSTDGRAMVMTEEERQPSMPMEEYMDRMLAVDTILEEMDPQILDQICPGWTDVIMAIQDWLEAERRGARVGYMQRNHLNRLEAAVVRDLSACELPLEELRVGVENRKISARQTRLPCTWQ